MSNVEAKTNTEPGAVATGPSADEWYAEVVRICKERGFARWFYADKLEWIECGEAEGYTPEQAVDYQYECLF